MTLALIFHFYFINALTKKRCQNKRPYIKYVNREVILHLKLKEETIDQLFVKRKLFINFNFA